MLTIDKVDISSKAQVNEFVMFHYNLYKKCPQWVPPFISDIKLMMNPNKHPFYEHSDADFFIAKRDGEVVGRIAAMENKPYNKYHESHQASFCLYDSINDQDVSNEVFERVFDWGHKRGLNKLVGPKGFGAFDGYGIQIEGFDHRQMMNMMNYNYDYYPKLVEKQGFEKEVDFVSTYLSAVKFHLPDKVQEIARRVEERGKFKVKRFKDKKELIKWAWPIGEAYNKTFVNNWEYYPFSRNEIKFMVDQLMIVADPRLVKIITYDDQIVGFLLGFPDISAAMQRQKGDVTPLKPWGVADLLIEMKRTKWISLNGAGVLPEYQGRGGNALMYAEMEKTVRDYKFEHAELTNVAETTKQMRADLKNVGSEEYKNHRVYHHDI
jgi:GNAT superfamily N-acetyltransferase